MMVQTTVVPGFALRLGVHSGRSDLPRHCHDDPTICYVIRGGFTEYSRGEVAECGSATLKVMPAGEPHSNRFGDADTQGLRDRKSTRLNSSHSQISYAVF